MKHRVIIIGAGAIGKIPSIMQSLKEKYGNDILLSTQEESKEQKLNTEKLSDIPSFKITASPRMQQPIISGTKPMDGKDKRREKRKQERKLLKGKK